MLRTGSFSPVGRFPLEGGSLRSVEGRRSEIGGLSGMNKDHWSRPLALGGGAKTIGQKSGAVLGRSLPIGWILKTVPEGSSKVAISEDLHISLRLGRRYKGEAEGFRSLLFCLITCLLLRPSLPLSFSL